MKSFGSLDRENEIFYISPLNQSLKTIKIRNHKNVLEGTWKGFTVIEFYKHIDLEGVDTETLEIAKATHGTDISNKIIIPSHTDMATIKSNPPTVVCTDREKLALWMAKTQ